MFTESIEPAWNQNVSTQKFSLTENRWHAWQMLPGYSGERCVPYCCPIYISRVTPLKSGHGKIDVCFWNTGYAEGVQDFQKTLKILFRGRNYLIGQLIEGISDNDRCAVISHIEFGWIEKFSPEIWHRFPPHSFGGSAESSVSIYLDSVFGLKKS